MARHSDVADGHLPGIAEGTISRRRVLAAGTVAGSTLVAGCGDATEGDRGSPTGADPGAAPEPETVTQQSIAAESHGSADSPIDVFADGVYTQSRAGQAIVFLQDGTAYAAGEDGLLAAGDDHSAVVQAALDQKGEVIFKQGTYRVNLTIPKHTVIRGAGRQVNGEEGVATLQPDDPSTPVFQYHLDDPVGNHVGFNTIIENLVIDGRGGDADLIAITGLFNLFIVDCVIENSNGRGIDFNKGWDCWVVRCKLRNTGSTDRELPQIHLRNDTGAKNPTNGIRILNCAGPSSWEYVHAQDQSAHNWIHNNRFETYSNGPYAVEFTSGCHRNFVTNNYIFGGTEGALKTAYRGVVANNDFTGGIPGDDSGPEDIGGHGVVLVDGDHVVSGNHIKGNAGSAISGTVNGSVVTGNDLRGGHQSGVGIDAVVDANPDVATGTYAARGRTYFTIANNVVHMFAGHGISVTGPSAAKMGLLQGNTVVTNNDRGDAPVGVLVDGVDGVKVIGNGVNNADGGETAIRIANGADTFVQGNGLENGGIDTTGSSDATVTANDV